MVRTSVTLRAALLCSYYVLTSSVRYQSTDARQNEIYLLIVEPRREPQLTCKRSVGNSRKFTGLAKQRALQKMSGRRNDRSEHLPTKVTPKSRKFQCKFCSKTHVMMKKLCPAWGKRCSVCGKMNHCRGSDVCEKKLKVHVNTLTFLALIPT